MEGLAGWIIIGFVAWWFYKTGSQVDVTITTVAANPRTVATALRGGHGGPFSSYQRFA